MKAVCELFYKKKIRVGIVSGWIRSIMKDAGIDREVYNLYSVKFATG
jgi:hypothetical protein